MLSQRVIPKWLVIGLVAAVASVGLCAWLCNRSARPNDFGLSLLIFALPVTLFTTVVAFLATAGKNSKRICGFCGYNRVGLAVETPCPECGNPGNVRNAPLHRAIGHRSLPFWIWFPAALALPGAIFVAYLTKRGELVLATISVFPLCFVAGIIWAWRQGRQNS